MSDQIMILLEAYEADSGNIHDIFVALESLISNKVIDKLIDIKVIDSTANEINVMYMLEQYRSNRDNCIKL